MRRTVPAMIALTVSMTGAQAGAQSKDDLARADAMFNAGKALVDAGQYADACAKFAESKRLVPGLGVTLYLADCYEHVGRSASAWTEFRSAEGLARERGDRRADVARARAQAIEPKLSRLTIAVSPSIPRTALQILRDGAPVAQEELGLAVPVDPGEHVVVVSSPGRKTRTLVAQVGPDHQAATVPIDSLDETETTASASAASPPAAPALPATTASPATTAAPATASPATTAAPATTATATTTSGGATVRWIGVGVGAIGVVGLGVGSVLGLAAMSKRDQSNSGPCDPTDHCTSPGLSLRQDALNDATGSTVAFLVGGIALATGAVLYVTAPHGSANTGIVVAPVPMAGGGGAIVRAAF